MGKRGKKRVLAAPATTPPMSQRTRGALQVAPWVLFFECIDSIDDMDADETQELKDKLVSKNLTDAFLPHMTSSQLL